MSIKDGWKGRFYEDLILGISTNILWVEQLQMSTIFGLLF